MIDKTNLSYTLKTHWMRSCDVWRAILYVGV